MVTPIVLTMGDPAGVGPELTVQAWQQLRQAPDSAFFVIGDPALYGPQAQPIADASEAATVFARALPVLPEPCSTPVTPGLGDSANGATTITSIDRAVALTQNRQARAVVTNPINKAVLYDAGFNHPGHTEYLGHLARLDRPTVMMLVDGDFRVVPITLHVSLSRAIAQLTPEVITHAVVTTDAYLRETLGILRPRLAVSGLNPHAGESGSMGHEEIDIIEPTLEALRQKGLDVRGPLPADTMFHARARASYDAALCMTHDQALIPIKTLGFDRGVNCTMGLPFVRTSPDHGTAYDIAGTGKALPDSLISAIHLADELSRS